MLLEADVLTIAEDDDVIKYKQGRQQKQVMRSDGMDSRASNSGLNFT